MNQIVPCAILIIALAVSAPAPAAADERRPPAAASDRHQAGQYFDQLGDRIDARLDERGYRLSEHYARQAARAEAAGKPDLAHRLQVKGERIREHFDRQGDRIDARLDRRGAWRDHRFAHGEPDWRHDDDRRHAWRDRRLTRSFDGPRYGGRCR